MEEENSSDPPAALASAFGKEKKPFTYTKEGAPDLSTDCRPSAVRRSQTKSPCPPVPRVLPIVPDEEKMQHLQYNTPMPLYSSGAAQEEYHRQAGDSSAHQHSSSQFSSSHEAHYSSSKVISSSSLHFASELKAIVGL